MAKLNPDRLPKHTLALLRVLLKRVLVLESHGVRIGRYEITALQRTIGYLDTHPVEGKP